MAEITLITGGSRSGKSRAALQLGETLGTQRWFVATCPRRVDDELDQRIQRHVAERRASSWQTHEEELDLTTALRRISADVIVVDCLTLWVNNLMFHADVSAPLHEADIVGHCQALAEAARQHAGHVIFVTNEVGLGIVPDNELARRYRDLVGRCNQTMAAAADHVTLMVSGLAMPIKTGGSS